MSVFQCQKCGGDIDFIQGTSVATCLYCGCKQTLPRLDDDRRANLYGRANHFRRNSEFDKAAGIYDFILNEDPTDAVAYWSLVLCAYGIDYVEDAQTGRLVPTVRRARYTSIFDDENYKAAVAFADASQLAVFEEEAQAINEIQKRVLAISQKEEPFDVFICYKETDDFGNQTEDSGLANDLYELLTQEGFRVFFSRATLKDKAGIEFEPYIFAALNSAKVMVVIGTRPEYYNAPWVKNEWSRYLALVKESGGEKVLIPVFRDMTTDELPREFSHLEAKDMSKLDFMPNLIRSIKKVASTEEPASTAAQSVAVVVPEGNANTMALLDRAQMALEDGEWDRADDFCEQVLNTDARNAMAYLYKLMAEIHVNKQGDLMHLSGYLERMSNYQKAVRFADAELRAFLEEANRNAIECRQREELEAKRKEAYEKALKAAEQAVTKQDFEAAAQAFERLGDYRDSASRAKAIRAEWARIEAVAEDIVKSYSAAGQSQKAKSKLEQLQERKQQLEAEKAARPGLLQKQAEAQQTAASLDQRLAQLRAKRESLGMFAFAEKRETDGEIAAAEKGLAEARSALAQTQASLRTVRDSAAVDVDLSECERAIAAEREAERQRAAAGMGSVRHTEADLRDPRVLKQLQTANPKTYALPAIQMRVPGGKVVFGRWGGESIEWRVIAHEKDRVLAIADKAIDCRRFDASSNTWETSELKRWLEGDFERGAFSDDERRMMGSHPFCLSVDEAKTYFSGNADRVCYPTAHTKKQGAWTNDKGACNWRLRSPGGDSSSAAYVSRGGGVGSLGVNIGGNAVRPALWLNL